jgi:hypothetical protein
MAQQNQHNQNTINSLNERLNTERTERQNAERQRDARPTQDQLREIERERNTIREGLEVIRQRLNLNRVEDLDNLPQLSQGETINDLLNRPTQQRLNDRSASDREVLG